MSLAWVGDYFIVRLENVFGDVLDLGQQFGDGLFILGAKVNVHAGKDCLDRVLGFGVDDFAVRVHRSQGEVELFAESNHAQVVAGDLGGADLDFGVLDEVVRGHPLWLLLGRDHFVDGFLHDRPTAGTITLQNEDCFFLSQQNLSSQQA